jgi:hypothetical protein
MRAAGSLVVLGVLLLSTLGGLQPGSRVRAGLVPDEGGSWRAPPIVGPFVGAGNNSVTIRTNDTRLLDNTRLASQLVLPSRAIVSTDAVNLWLVEPLNQSEEVGVGLEVNISHGTVAASAEWGSWDKGGSSTIRNNASLVITPGTPVVLSIAWAGADDWNLTINGVTVPATPGGVLNLGVSVADNVPYGGGSDLPDPVPALVTSSTGPFPFAQLSWSQGFVVGSGNSPVLPGDGYVEASSAVWGVVGQDQQIGAAPDEFNESPSLPVLPNGTYVWGIGNANFPPVAAWTSTDPSAFSVPGGALEITVPPAELPSHAPVGICQELLEPLDNGRWLTIGACWDGGVGVRAYAAVTDADGAAYQQTMYVSLPSAGETALIAVRDVGPGVWHASVNGQLMVDARGNSSIVGGADLGNSSMGPYGALRGFPSAALPTVLAYPEGILVYPSVDTAAPFLPPEGRIADSDARPPALVEGHLQNASLPNGMIQVLPGRTPLPFQTQLWGASQSNATGSWWAPLFPGGSLELVAFGLVAAGMVLTVVALHRRNRRGSVPKEGAPINPQGSLADPPESGV